MEFKQVVTTSETYDKKLKRKPRASALQKKRYVQRWKESNMSRSAFCTRHNLNVNTFYQWCKKVGAPTDKISAPEMLNNVDPKLSQADICFELQLPNGILLRLTGSVEWALVLAVIKEVTPCKFS